MAMILPPVPPAHPRTQNVPTARRHGGHHSRSGPPHRHHPLGQTLAMTIYAASSFVPCHALCIGVKDTYTFTSRFLVSLLYPYDYQPSFGTLFPACVDSCWDGNDSCLLFVVGRFLSFAHIYYRVFSSRHIPDIFTLFFNLQHVCMQVLTRCANIVLRLGQLLPNGSNAQTQDHGSLYLQPDNL